MATPKTAVAGKGLKKKAGPLPVWGWAVVAMGSYGIYRYIKARQTASSAAAGGVSVPLTGGTTIPTGGSGTAPGGTTTAAATSYPDFGSWQTAAIGSLAGSGLSGADSLNAISSWLNGSCVSAKAYTALSGLIGSIGLPPGWGLSVPPLSACPTAATNATTGGSGATPGPTTPPPAPGAAPGAPPNLPQSLIAQMTQNGEHLVDTQWDPTYQSWIFLTNKGGIYNLNQQGQQGGGFFGSLFSLPAGTFAGRQAAKLTITPTGYTVTDTAGEGYTFDPAHNAATKTAAATPKAA